MLNILNRQYIIPVVSLIEYWFVCVLVTVASVIVVLVFVVDLLSELSLRFKLLFELFVFI